MIFANYSNERSYLFLTISLIRPNAYLSELENELINASQWDEWSYGIYSINYAVDVGNFITLMSMFLIDSLNTYWLSIEPI